MFLFLKFPFILFMDFSSPVQYPTFSSIFLEYNFSLILNSHISVPCGCFCYLLFLWSCLVMCQDTAQISCEETSKVIDSFQELCVSFCKALGVGAESLSQLSFKLTGLNFAKFVQPGLFLVCLHCSWVVFRGLLTRSLDLFPCKLCTQVFISPAQPDHCSPLVFSFNTSEPAPPQGQTCLEPSLASLQMFFCILFTFSKCSQWEDWLASSQFIIARSLGVPVLFEYGSWDLLIHKLDVKDWRKKLVKNDSTGLFCCCCFVLFCFYGTGDQTPNHALARQVLMPLSSIPSPSTGFLQSFCLPHTIQPTVRMVLQASKVRED
ncbi:uncharacterized protein LOC134473654 [Cavia porcellus]|uniref:uncharacterized protein LOC134473654 n=1 Tax=Cavia porcellus TaxID=10141 RepID=UPI002FE15738